MKRARRRKLESKAPRTVSFPAPDDPLAESEAAELLRIHVQTLREIRRDGKGPKVQWIGRRPIYIRGDVIDWLKSQKGGPQASAA